MPISRASRRYVAAPHELAGERRWLVYDVREPNSVVRKDMTEAEAVALQERLKRQVRIIEAMLKPVTDRLGDK